jgi:hypothetical protein
LERIYAKLDGEIPLTQAAYRAGRSTTEQVFSMKLVAEKAAITTNYESNILLLDMSKAFDSVDREILLKDLEAILDEDELHMIQILIKDVVLFVRNGKATEDKFKTNVGVPQGDCLSPILFTLYLAKALKENEMKSEKECNRKTVSSENHVPNVLKDHSYATKQERKPKFMCDQQFADDLSWMSEDKKEIDEIESKIPRKNKSRRLTINKDKTEKLSVSKSVKSGTEKCKYLGSFLDTTKDIARRQQLSMVSYTKYCKMLTSKRLPLYSRMRLFNAYVTSIFMYNSELWTLTKKLENEIAVF